MTEFSVLTSSQNPRLKAAQKLRDRRSRERQQRIIIDGLREIRAALSASVEIDELFCNEEWIEREEVASVCAAAQRAGGSIFALPAHLFEKIEYGSRGQGLVATAATPERPLHAFTPRERSGEHDFFAVVDRLEKPGNLGAILRTADAAGAGGLIATDGATDLFNPNAIRSSLGSVFQLPAAVAAADDVVEWLTARNTTILAARVDAATPISAVDLRRPVAIVLGSESAGLGDAWRRKCVTPVTLPMRGSVDSLNVSAAAAAMFYEVVRQRLT